MDVKGITIQKKNLITESINVRLTPEEKEALRILALELDTPVSTVVRNLIQQFIAKNTSLIKAKTEEEKPPD